MRALERWIEGNGLLPPLIADGECGRPQRATQRELSSARKRLERRGVKTVSRIHTYLVDFHHPLKSHGERVIQNIRGRTAPRRGLAPIEKIQRLIQRRATVAFVVTRGLGVADRSRS